VSSFIDYGIPRNVMSFVCKEFFFSLWQPSYKEGYWPHPAHICIFSAFSSPPSTGTNSSLGQHSVYFLSTLQIVKFIFLVTSIKQQTLAGVGLINFTSVCFITEDTEMWCLLTVALKQVFYMASILRSLHIPALNANQRTRKKIKKYPIWILRN
jgi:hypothetical protein